LNPPANRTSQDTEYSNSHGNSLKLAELAHLSGDSVSTELAFRQQIAAFLILEFGVVFHSVIIGLNLGVVGDEFSTLYPVLVFHQTFEGLGIGARLSVIPFPSRLRWMPWALCLAYGLTTPISVAIGLGLRYSYNGNSYTANVVSGVLDSTSAGILIYTGLVEMLARDFLYNPSRTRDRKRILFMLVSLYLGAGIMALLGKWA
jgi:zinc transporter 1/2/3